MKDIENIYHFATSIEALKKLERFRDQFFWKDYPTTHKYESVADHTWRLAVLVMSLATQLSKPFDLQKALKMTLIHDLPEIVAGDQSPLGDDGTGANTHAYNEELAKEKLEKEKRAARMIFEKLPENEREEFFKLWLECEEMRSFEAQVVKALDKMECMLQVLEYRKGHMFKDHLEFTINYGMKHANVDPAIEAFGHHIVNQLRKHFKEYKKV